MLLTGLSFRGVMSSQSHVNPQCAVFSGVHQRAAAEASQLTEAGGPAQRTPQLHISPQGGATLRRQA